MTGTTGSTTAESLTALAAWEHVKAVVNFKYPRDRHTGRANQLIREVVKNLKFKYKHQPDKHVDGLKLTAKVSTFQNWMGVQSDRHLNRILQQVEEIKMLSRDNGTIVYT